MTVATVIICNIDFLNFHKGQVQNFKILKLAKRNQNFTIRF
jgi:hypothetical protein